MITPNKYLLIKVSISNIYKKNKFYVWGFAGIKEDIEELIFLTKKKTNVVITLYYLTMRS